MRYSVVNLGCKVNRVESDNYETLFETYGFAYTDSHDADVVVVNTCTVTGEAEKKTRKAVRQALKRFPAAAIVVTGCASAINPDFFTSLDERIVVVAKPAMESYLKDLLATRTEIADSGSPASVHSASAYKDPVGISASDISESDIDVSFLSPSRTRMGVKVQDGCDNACTYCIVHVARGRATSRPIDQIVSDVLRLVESGVYEIVLSGINIGSYNYEGIRLTGLLEALLSSTACFSSEFAPFVRFRVSSVEPMDIEEDFIALLASSGGRICRHLHLPLQSGSSKVLREMARPYDAEDFKRLVDLIRAEVPEISLSTDIIVGFPGETDDEFNDTLEMAKYCEFSKIHVFPYSKREGTPAADRIDQVPPEVKTERARQLRDLSDYLRHADYQSRVSRNEYVLVEQSGVGMTESYHEVPLDTRLPAGSLIELLIPSKQMN